MPPEPRISTPSEIAAVIAERIRALPPPAPRHLVAIAGGPGSGKSTVAQTLCTRLNAAGTPAGLVPMDGFHLDNDILDARGLRPRKGAPDTFDLGGFNSILERLQRDPEVIVPRFDRERDLSIGSATVIGPETTTVIVEGNYLLLDQPGWRDLARHWSLAIFLSPDLAEVENRLVRRWQDLGLSQDEVRQRVAGNDLPNARLVQEKHVQADLTLTL